MSEVEANGQRLAAVLDQLADAPLMHCIDGVRVPSVGGDTFINHTPIDNSEIGLVAAGGPEDIDRACTAATRAFPGWAGLAGSQRKEILHNIADAIVDNAQDIALLESYDTGQPIRFMSKAAVRGAENFRFFADRAPGAADGLSLPAQDHLNFSTRQPIGPVGVITPWNTPFMLSTWKIAPALAAGCTVVHKPAEWSPCTADLLSRIMHDAGLPDGVLNTVHGFGETAGRALTEHSDINAIAFVGESATGSQIMRQGSETLKRVHFELGGKNPVIVFEDADLEKALDAVVFMIYSLNGERCTSSSRLLIQESIREEFTTRLAERVQHLKVGHPLDPATEVGPLIHPRHHDKVCGYFELARQEGAQIAVGGTDLVWNGSEVEVSADRARLQPDRSGGNFVAPTLFVDAANHMRIAQEEIFGPVLTAITFGTEAEAVSLANDVRYGLAAYVWTTDSGRSLRVARDLDVGMVWVNSENNRHLMTPFGGMKASGIGRDGGDYSFDFYMETKNVCIAHGSHAVPKLGV